MNEQLSNKPSFVNLVETLTDLTINRKIRWDENDTEWYRENNGIRASIAKQTPILIIGEYKFPDVLALIYAIKQSLIPYKKSAVEQWLEGLIEDDK